MIEKETKLFHSRRDTNEGITRKTSSHARTVGAKVGVTRETILLEKGKYNPSLKPAYDIAKALNSKIEDVFIFEE